MRYERRWQYLFAIIFFVTGISYLFDFKSLLEQTNQFKIVHENQLAELAQLKVQKNNQRKVVNRDKEKLHPFLLEKLVPLLGVHHMQLRAMNHQGSQMNNGVEMDVMRLTIEGQFADMQRLLIVMTQLSSSVLLNFSFKATSSNKALFTLDLLLWQGVAVGRASADNSFKINIQNPMCFSKDELLAESAAILLQRTALSRIKMIGYIAGAKGAQALVLLPGGGIAEIEIGMMIGAEQARVESITENAITVQYDGKRVLLSQVEAYHLEEEGE